MTYEEYMTCKTLACCYAADPECPGNCNGCAYRYKKDEELGLANNLTPKTGSFIGWKVIKLEKVTSDRKRSLRTFVLPDGTQKDCKFALVRLQIPEDAKRSSGYDSNKCRCSKAQVLDIWPVWQTDDGGYELYNFLDADHGYSWRNPDFEYHKGETVSVSDFDEFWWNVCSRGIHFFMTIRDVFEYLKEND